jgi:hypothetical protein
MYIGLPVPFATADELSIHFQKHGHKFGAATEADYEKMADAFMSNAWNPGLFDCIRNISTSDRIRLEGATLFFGIAFGVLTLRSFYPKDANAIAAGGGPAGFVARKCAEKR